MTDDEVRAALHAAARYRAHQEALQLERELEAEHRRQKTLAAWSILIGALLILFGVAVTIVTRDAAVEAGGGRYVFAYGPIIAGAIAVVRGLVVVARANR
jgi:uncharacterized membrane protein YcjF (UPF0283 family)